MIRSLYYVFTLFIALVFNPCQGQDQTNLALKKPTSSNGHLEHCENQYAVDGEVHHKYISLYDKDNWWMVDLTTLVYVNEIKIYNRDDCCEERLENAVISVIDADGNVVQSQVVTREESLNDIITYNFENAAGRYVNISQATNYLQLGDVEVFGELPVIQGSSNIALNQRTSTNAQAPEYPHEYAVDGHFDTMFHSAGHNTSFWEVDLQNVAVIRQITIYNRHDCCEKRLLDAVVSVKSNEHHVVAHNVVMEQNGQSKVIIFMFPGDNPPRGRFIEVQLANDFLHFSEFQVYGELSTAGLTDAAFNKTTTTNSQIGSDNGEYQATNAVNGNLESFYHSQHRKSWWTVDLETQEPIRQITILNRPQMQERMINTSVFILDNYGHVVWSHTITEAEVQRSDAIVFDFPERPPGRLVHLSQPYNYLHFVEVQVFR